MTSVRRRKRGTITIRPVLRTRVETAFDYYRRKALHELARDAENMRIVFGMRPNPLVAWEVHEWQRDLLTDPE